jgi:predicted DNA-binding mobile mystery protein A
MSAEYSALRGKQLDRALEPFRTAKTSARPRKGWLRAIRQALGMSARELGLRLGTSRQRPLQLEMAEADDRITLKSLRAAADALDCDLVYALVPRSSIDALRTIRLRDEAAKRVLSVEHSMALEDQAVGHLDDEIDAETSATVGGRGRR